MLLMYVIGRQLDANQYVSLSGLFAGKTADPVLDVQVVFYA